MIVSLLVVAYCRGKAAMLKHIQNSSGYSTLERRRGMPDCSAMLIRPNSCAPTLKPNGPIFDLNGSLPNRTPLSSSLHNTSSLSTASKFSNISSGVCATTVPGPVASANTTGLDRSREPHSTDVSAFTTFSTSMMAHTTPRRSLPPHAIEATPSRVDSSLCRQVAQASLPRNAAVKRMLLCLSLMCVSSLLLAILAAIFLLKVTPLELTALKLREAGGLHSVSAEQYAILYEITVALTALSVCLDLCCLLVCSTQLVLCVKLTKAASGEQRSEEYLRESSPSRVFAIVGYFLSIPVFLSGVVLYTFMHFHSTSAVTTSIFLTLGILFCAAATAHNVDIWHRVRRESKARYQLDVVPKGADSSSPHRFNLHSSAICNVNKNTDLPSPTLDLSVHANISNLHELSTLV